MDFGQKRMQFPLFQGYALQFGARGLSWVIIIKGNPDVGLILPFA